MAVFPSFVSSSADDEFLRIELNTGLMFANIALQAVYEDKRKRNCANARRAYDSLLHFIPKLPNGKFAVSEKMTNGLAQLKSRLQRLGEEF